VKRRVRSPKARLGCPVVDGSGIFRGDGDYITRVVAGDGAGSCWRDSGTDLDKVSEKEQQLSESGAD